jgi:hypothetical protein
MKQIIILIFTLLAGVLGIYFAQEPPYTHIAAGAVIVATIIGIIQTTQDAKDAAFVKQTLSHLVKSIPPSLWWKAKVNELVIKISKSEGYHCRSAVYTRSDPGDPEADCILLFYKKTEDVEPAGLLVLTPSDYSDLSSLEVRKLEDGVKHLLFGVLGATSAALVAERVTDTLAALYALARFGQGFKIVTKPLGANNPLTVEVGNARFEFKAPEVERLVQMPPIERDLFLARELEKVEGNLSRFLKESA